MGDNPASERNYKREYALWKKRPNAMKDMVARVQARREMIKEYGKEALAGKDIDHVQPLRDPGTNNARSNLRIADASRNRAWRKGKKGYD